MTEKKEEASRYLAIISRSKERAVGVREVTKALKSGRAAVIFLADDVDERAIKEIVEIGQEKGVKLVKVASRSELGRACQIEVDAAAAALLNKQD